MCLIGWRLDRQARWPLLLAANRDEYHFRETQPAQRWPVVDREPGCALVGGRDLRAGGTWLAVAVRETSVRVAALTNLRDGTAAPIAPGTRSRGLLVTDALYREPDGGNAFRPLAADPQLSMMAGFNLLAIDVLRPLAPGERPAVAAWCLSHPGAASDRNEVLELDEGIGSLSNGPPRASWPKGRRIESALASSSHQLEHDVRAGVGTLQDLEIELLAALADRSAAPDDQLPETGVGRERERWLSPVFVCGPGYGTRCSTVVIIGNDGSLRFTERRFDAEGRPSGDTTFSTEALWPESGL